MSNYYKILGVSKNSTSKEIKLSYKKLALKWHPDKNPNNLEMATRRFNEICEAYETLSNRKKRKAYDLRIQQSLENLNRTTFAKDCNIEQASCCKFKTSDDIFREVFGTSVYKDLFGVYNLARDDNVAHRSFPLCHSVSADCSINTLFMRENVEEKTINAGTIGASNKEVTIKRILKNGKEIVDTYENGILKSKIIHLPKPLLTRSR